MIMVFIDFSSFLSLILFMILYYHHLILLLDLYNLINHNDSSIPWWLPHSKNQRNITSFLSARKIHSIFFMIQLS